jgi:hypothetical protein
MRTKIFLIALLMAGVGLHSKGQSAPGISGYVRNYTGVLLSDGNEFSIVQNTLNLQFEQRLGKVAFKVNPYLYHYFDRDLEIGLREAYLDMYFDKFDLRVGKQQIIYGKAEGVFITDVVSPKDLSEFLLPDFDEIRMGVTAAKLSYHAGNNSLEVTWIPVFTPTRMPGAGSIWQPVMPFPVQPDFDYSTAQITPSVENSEWFLRFSSLGSKIDYELVAGTFYNDDPVYHLTRHVNSSTGQLAGITARPEYHRLAMAGGSFSLPLGPLVIRSEGGYYSGRYFQTESPEMINATIKKDYLHYMAGLDFTLAGVRMSSQFIQEFITDYEEGIRNDQFESTMTFLAKKDFLREKLWVELFAYAGLNAGDALIRPKVSYSFADGFDIQAGANIFTGSEGRFGQYNANDMLYAKLKFSF